MSEQREKDILEFVRNYIRRNKISPSVREICEGMGIRSTSTVHRYLHRLEANGCIDVNSGKKRAIFLKESYTQPEIPVIAGVKAGTDLFSSENIQSYYHTRLTQKQKHALFAFHLRKDAPEYCILKTDMLIAETETVPEKGRFTVFLTEDGFPEITQETVPENREVIGTVMMILRSFE